MAKEEKELKGILLEKASNFQRDILTVLLEQDVSFEKRSEIISRLQYALHEFLAPTDYETASVDSEVKAKETLVKQIKKFIESQNLTYTEASAKLGVRVSVLSNWLRGQSRPSRTSVRRVREILKKLSMAHTEAKKEEEKKDEDVPF